MTVLKEQPQNLRRGIPLAVRQLRKTFGEREVLRDIDLNIPAGQFVAIVGRSGCGKSTLLRLLAALDQPTSGQLLAGSGPLSEARNDTRLMFQEARLLPWKRVIDNVGLGLSGNWREQAHVEIPNGHFTAIIGPNGCGKSTLLKIILGQLEAVSGTCRVSVQSAYLDQHLSQLDLTQSVMTHLNLHDTPLEEGVLRSRLAQLQLGADKVSLPLRELSGGERLKAALACVLWREEAAQLLLLDEPTNHLDLASVQAIEAALAGFPGALLVVSHDQAFLNGLQLTHEMVWDEKGWRYERL